MGQPAPPSDDAAPSATAEAAAPGPRTKPPAKPLGCLVLAGLIAVLAVIGSRTGDRKRVGADVTADGAATMGAGEDGTAGAVPYQWCERKDFSWAGRRRFGGWATVAADIDRGAVEPTLRKAALDLHAQNAGDAVAVTLQPPGPCNAFLIVGTMHYAPDGLGWAGDAAGRTWELVLNGVPPAERLPALGLRSRSDIVPFAEVYAAAEYERAALRACETCPVPDGDVYAAVAKRRRSKPRAVADAVLKAFRYFGPGN
jgi:hypothetical protein